MQLTLTNRPATPFWDRMAPGYAKKRVSDPSAYEEKLALLAKLLEPTDKVLEIGCGTGTTALRLAPGVAHYTATDGSAKMIEIARSKQAGATPAPLEFRQADAARDVEGQPFDAIFAFSLLHLIDDLPGTLESIRRQLRPGGRFISKTVCLKKGPLWIRLLLRVMRAVGFAPPVMLLSKDDLIRDIEAAGFEIESVQHFGKNRLSPFIIARKPA